MVASPLQIFHGLLSETESKRQWAYKALGSDGTYAVKPVDVRLLWVNMDADSQQEAILVYSDGSRGAAAHVFAKRAATWWEVGVFDDWWHWSSERMDEFVTLKETAEYGQKDILIRTTGGGSGMQETRLTIYRLYQSRLYRVFTTVEESLSDIMTEPDPQELTTREQRKIAYRDTGNSNNFLIVQHIRTKYASRNVENEAPIGKPQIKGCAAYGWEPGRFSFVWNREATKRFCSPAAKQTIK